MGDHLWEGHVPLSHVGQGEVGRTRVEQWELAKS